MLTVRQAKVIKEGYMSGDVFMSFRSGGLFYTVYKKFGDFTGTLAISSDPFTLPKLQLEIDHIIFKLHDQTRYMEISIAPDELTMSFELKPEGDE